MSPLAGRIYFAGVGIAYAASQGIFFSEVGVAGLAAVVWCFPAWLANVFFVVGLWHLWNGRSRSAARLGIIALTCGMLYAVILFNRELGQWLLVSSGLWYLSFVLLGLANLWRWSFEPGMIEE